MRNLVVVGGRGRSGASVSLAHPSLQEREKYILKNER